LPRLKALLLPKLLYVGRYGISKRTLDYWKKHLLNTENYPEDELAKLRKENVMLRSIIVDKDLDIAYLKELLKIKKRAEIKGKNRGH